MAFQPTDQQLEAIPLLASGESYSKVAKTVGTSSSTVCRWLKNPDFRKQVEAIQEQKLEVTKNVVLESATVKAENLQGALQRGLHYQNELIESTQQITTKCLNLLSEAVDQVDRLVRAEDRDMALTPKEKALLNFTPSLMRNAATLIGSLSDFWDKKYAIEEISKRLDAWETHWSEQDRN